MYLFGGHRLKGVQLPTYLSTSYHAHDEAFQNTSSSLNLSESILEREIDDGGDYLVRVTNDATERPSEEEDNEVDESVGKGDSQETDKSNEAQEDGQRISKPFGQGPRRLTYPDLRTELDMSSSLVFQIEPGMYQDYSNLVVFILSDNAIEEIPSDMPNYLPCLKVLHLDGNKISCLPESIGHWKNLRELKLGSEFGGNFIESVPDTLSQMTNLLDLNFSHNHITHVSTLLPSNLRHLNLSYNGLQTISSHIFTYSRQLETIDLSHNRLTSLSQDFADGVLRSSAIRVLNLSHNSICILPSELMDESSAEIILYGNPLLQFQIEDGAEGNGYFEAVRRLLRQSMPTIRRSMPNERYNTEEYINMSLERQVSGMHPSRLLADSQNDYSQEDDHQQPLSSTGVCDDKEIPYMIHSLREIALRDTVLHMPSAITSLPFHIASVVKDKKRCCPVCDKPFIDEWVSSVQLRNYQGNPSTVSKVRFCSTRCWQIYREDLEERSLQFENDGETRQRALAFIEEEGEPLQPGSLSWIMAAVTASREQEERMHVLANII